MELSVINSFLHVFKSTDISNRSYGALNATRFLEKYGEVDLKFKLIVHIKESFKMNSRQNTNTNKTFSDRLLISTFIFVCFQDDKITVHDLRDIKDGTIL